MALPFFYKASFNTTAGATIMLDEDTSKHIVQVLRMQTGEQLQLADGKGNVATASITDDNRKKCTVQVISNSFYPAPSNKITIAISLLKNNSRFEWFLEKAAEMGVQEIIPLICTRTEKQHFKAERLQSILISAMLQSQQCWLPQMGEPVKFASCVQQNHPGQKFIAHCEEGNKTQLSSAAKNDQSKLILIGPEGDFTPEEIQLAIENDFAPVSLGNTRLRTETAGVVAAALLCVQ
ncbi:MAG: 16S rRNA (uracil(1498)-N(3))-methyltransferase [Bacteroidetes bacterium]|nr:16S rRNA (uracil(1498)-N(3))-methyltransferase [Bacteroidota bacterium]